MPNDQQSPSRNQKFQSILSSAKTNLPPAVIAAEANQLLYPVNTIATRLINYQGKVTNWEKFNQAVFFDLAKQGKNITSSGTQIDAAHTTMTPYNAITKLNSLNKGFMTAAVNNGSTRTYRFLVQDQVQKGIQGAIKPYTKNLLEDKNAQTLSAGLSGMATGVSERLIFHPLDTRKILKQMESNSTSGLYNGVGVGALRDGISAGIFFGSYYGFYNFLKDHNYVFSPSKKENKDIADKLIGSTGSGMVTSITTNPLNVVKTRMQAKGSSAGILSAIKNSYAKEGVSSIVNGNLFKDLSKAIQESKSSGLMATAADIYAKEGLSGFGKGLGVNVMQAPLRSTLPFFAFLFAKGKWDDYQKNSKQDANKVCDSKPMLAALKA